MSAECLMNILRMGSLEKRGLGNGFKDCEEACGVDYKDFLTVTAACFRELFPSSFLMETQERIEIFSFLMGSASRQETGMEPFLLADSFPFSVVRSSQKLLNCTMFSANLYSSLWGKSLVGASVSLPH